MVGLTKKSVHGSFQYQKQLQDLVEKNAAAQGMKRKLDAELNDVSWPYLHASTTHTETNARNSA